MKQNSVMEPSEENQTFFVHSFSSTFSADCFQFETSSVRVSTALLKNLGPADSGGHSTIFMEEGVRNTLI